MSYAIDKNELLQVALRFSIFSLATFITVKWLMKQIDPTNKQKRSAAAKAEMILSKLGIKSTNELNEHELMIASHLIDPKEIRDSWGTIGGLEAVITEIKESILLPIRRKDLFTDSELTKPPRGVLLHGPPGCGKTMIARATAREASCRFINLDLSILTDKWYGESQKLAAAVFSLAVKLQPCIIFIDEIDSFLRNRNVQDHEATAMMKAQFMTLWDGLTTDPNSIVIVMGATNRPMDLDKAILRRMPASFHVPLPKLEQRRDILKIILKDEPLDEDVNLDAIASGSEGLSGADLKELCRDAALYRVREFVQANRDCLNKEEKDGSDDEEFKDVLRPIKMEDIKKSLQKMRETKVVSSGNVLLD